MILTKLLRRYEVINANQVEIINTRLDNLEKENEELRDEVLRIKEILEIDQPIKE